MRSKENVEQIRWFLDFLNLDIQRLEYGERLKRIAETICVIDFAFHTIPPKPLPNIILPEGRFWDDATIEKRWKEWTEGGQLQRCHARLKEFYAGVMERVKQAIEGGTEWKSARRLDNQFLLSEIESKVRVRLETPLVRDIKFEEKGGELLYAFKEGTVKETSILLTLNAPTDEDALVYRLCQALEGISLGALGECPECKKWFLRTTKKERIFCCNRCAARKASRDRRARIKKTDPQRYEQEKKEGGERAKKSYRRKLHKEHPKAKVADRRGKHKG